MDVVIIGAGGHGKVVLDILRADRKHRVVGFIDADTSLTDTRVGGVPVLGPINQLPKLRRRKVTGAVVAIGDNRARLQSAGLVLEAGMKLVSAVHPRAVVSKSAKLGANAVICAGAVICTETVIGDSVIINTSAVVDHEGVIASGAHVCPNAALAGRVNVGEGAFIGIGATVLQCLAVGAWATIGGGAVVVRDVPERAVVVGVPARVIRTAAA